MIVRSVRPVALLVPTLVATIAVVLQAPSMVRLVPLIAALVVVPGVVVVRHIRPSGRSAALAVAAAAGLAWLVLASEVLVYARWWKPAALLPATVLFSAVVALVPIHRAAHSIRRGWDHRVTAGLLIGSTGLVVALQVIAIRRAPYSSTELQTLQSAFVQATEGTPGTGPLPSLLSALQARLIPFERATVGTMLAGRWLQIGFVALVVALAGFWARTGMERRGRGAVWAIVVASAAAVSVDGTRPDALLAAAALMAAGCCLTPGRDETSRPGVAGVLLGVAALGSRTCALAAAALVWRELIVVSTGGQPRLASPWSHRGYRILAGSLCGATGMLAGAALLDVRPGALRDALPPLAGDAVWIALPVMALLLVVAVVARRRLATRRPGGRDRNLPLVAFTGAVLGGAIEFDPTIADLAIPAILLATAIARSVWFGGVADAEQRVVDRGVRAPRRFWPQIAVSVLVVGIPIGTRSIEMRGAGNADQVARIAFILDHTGKNDAVFDLFGTASVLRRQVDRSQIDAATFAFVPLPLVSADPELAAVLRANFEPTPFPDLWRAVLDWSVPVPASGSGRG